MNRRSALAALAGGLAWSFSLLPGRALAVPLPGHRPEADLARKLVGVLRRPASAAAVGRAYLARFPHEAAPARLVEVICGALRGDDDDFDPTRCGRRELRRRVAARVRADFAAGRTVAVQGWVLGETEARLFALAALGAAGRGGGA